MPGLSLGLAQMATAASILSTASVPVNTPDYQIQIPAPEAKVETKIVPKQVQKPVQKPKLPSIPQFVVPTDIHGLIYQYAPQYGANAGVMVHIANCESGMRPNALSSSGTYAGMFQFNASTWSSNRRAMGLNPDPNLRFNAEEAIKTAAFKMGRDGYGAWPVCGKKALASIK